MSKDVFSQGRFVQKGLCTAGATISCTLGNWNMGLSMLFKIGCCSESLSAFRTLEGLFTSVDFLVSFKVWYLESLIGEKYWVT